MPLADPLQHEVAGHHDQQPEQADPEAQHDGEADVQDDEDPTVVVVQDPDAQSFRHLS